MGLVYPVGPADQVVYESDPIEATKLLIDSVNYFNPNQYYNPPDPPVAYRRPPRLVDQIPVEMKIARTDDPPGGTIYFHELQNPGGERQLLILTGFFSQTRDQAFSATSILDDIPSSGIMTSRPEQMIEVYLPRWMDQGNHSLRYYAGQPDPNDPTHFTFGYAIDGQRGTIDGRLNLACQVILTFRDGPATRQSAP